MSKNSSKSWFSRVVPLEGKLQFVMIHTRKEKKIQNEEQEVV